jgi:hypothetical protein
MPTFAQGGSGSESHDDPLTLPQIRRLWSRDRITNFTFPQPPRPLLKGFTEEELFHTVGENISSVGFPQLRDVSGLPEGHGQSFEVFATNNFGLATPLTVFGPEDRRIYKDTTYPWRSMGRVVTAAGTGAGVLIGPRHLLTASHVIDWTTNSKGEVGWILFEPDYYEGDVFKPTYGTFVYYVKQVKGTPCGNTRCIDEDDRMKDYVVVVLDRYAGNELGYLGARRYSTNWNGQNYWYHVGYPLVVGSATKPAWEGPFSIVAAIGGRGLEMKTYADLTPGDSGGPVFAWWNTPVPGPYAIGVASAEDDPNWLAGGDSMVKLVSRSRNEFP